MTAIAAVTYNQGSIEYVEVVVTANVSLSAQPVVISMDGSTWLAAEWEGSAGTTRTARTSTPVTFSTASGVAKVVRVKVTDTPEIPIMVAGTYTVRAAA